MYLQYGKDTKREGMSEEELLSKKSDTENIQQNLLLPRGIPEVRHRASYQVRIYKAEDLPRMKSGLMANVKKAMTGDDRPSVSPYVQVSFAGQTGRTSADKSTYDPAWNEQVVFTDLFPPLCQRIKVQLRDDDMVLDSVIGTHYVNMNHISSRGAKGFMHTFGPCWVNLYGSPRGYMLTDSHDYLNDGIGEGVAYRGRLLIAVKVEILGNSESSPLQVTREATMPISENAAGVKMEYFLWGTILEATMIDKKFADKFVSFELSMGNYGNSIDGKHFYRHTSLDEHAQEEPQQETEEMVLNQTPPMKPHSRGKNYYHIPFHEKKPCLYAKTRFEDQRQRLQRTNVLNAMVESLEDELKEVQHLLDHEEPGGKRMRRALSHFANSCSQFCNSIHGQAARATSGKTKLDKERLKMLERKISKFGTEARQLKAGIKSVEDTEKVLEAMKKSKQMLKKVKDISEEPQHSIPDVFIWMIVDKKRIAYCRIDSKTILHSAAEEEMGRYCGKVHTRFLRGSKNRQAVIALIFCTMWCQFAQKMMS
ncbi:otoferlin-like [Lingula anatina]|uniref:Otoferlin-like n=1 Tax=Lingula anatina TaxID=7574 RepID=A0A1S3ID79_LINAN|nr:otoferlin-like [Lingula anatina]|eukprot:XP_013396113.1 otoferlin-like [Lingula anatina]